MNNYALMDDSIPYSPLLGAMFGACGALLIQQIHYWCSKNKEKGHNYKEGHYWTYNTYKQWEVMFKYFDERSIRRHITLLVEKNIVITGRFNKFKYDKTKWYRLNYPALDKLTNTLNPTYNLATSTGQNVGIETYNLSAPIPEKYTENTAETNHCPNPKHKNKTTEKDMLKKNPKVPTTAAKVSSTLLAPKATDLKNMNASKMYKVWVSFVPEFHPSIKFVGTFTEKQKGMISSLVTLWGDNSGLVLKYVIEHWVKFGKLVMSSVGTKTFPDVPSPEKVFQYRVLAMNFYLASSVSKDGSVQLIATKKIGNITIKKIGVSKDVQIVEENTQEVEDKPATLEEILALKPVLKYNLPKK